MNKKMKTAWVTGGSSGIGLELTKRLLKDNFQVCIFAHAGIEQAVIELQKCSPAVCGFEVDVQNESSIIANFAEAVTAFGTPDLLINSAGIAIAKSFEDMTSEEYLRQININLVGSRNVAHAALPYLKQAVQQGKSPKLVLVASAAGLVGCYGYTGYCSSKLAWSVWLKCYVWNCAVRKLKLPWFARQKLKHRWYLTNVKMVHQSQRH